MLFQVVAALVVTSSSEVRSPHHIAWLCRPLKEGEPVLISYGNLQNDFLLMVSCVGC